MEDAKMRLKQLLLIMITAIMAFTAEAASPPDNTIPVIGLKPSFENMGTDFLCYLSWHNLDGLSAQFHTASDILHNLVLPGDTTGMLTLVNPWRMTDYSQLWAHMYGINTESAYALPVWNGRTVHNETFTSDSQIRRLTPWLMADTLESIAADLRRWFNDNSSSVWFYYGSDEIPAKQWAHMLNNSTGLDDYIPNFFTQDSHYVYRPDLDSTWRWQPTMGEVDPGGMMSWMAYYIHKADSTREMSHVISCMHVIKDWALYNNTEDARNNSTPAGPADQAATVRSIFTMQYQEHDSGGGIPPALQNNFPSFIALDAYPYRLVGTEYQKENSYTQHLGDSLENWMLDHYEECMDSTFIPAWEIRNDYSRHVSVFFVPQSFGRAGGTAMWNRGQLSYGRYGYRIPTPQDYRMACNTALIRGAKALLPYCMSSYASGPRADRTDAGLLDENNIPFDAPFEEWAYMDRPQDSISYISPDLIAPFIPGYDPLYDLPHRPTVNDNQRDRENFLLWKFAAYGRLWNSAKRTFGDIARVAPELALLNWWEGFQNEADIYYDGTEPFMFRSPRIKIFTDEDEENCYLFYLNRYCRANNNPYEITVTSSDLPTGTPFTIYAMDHNNRYLVEGTLARPCTYTFLDTLDAGEGRLLQMIDPDSISQADIRITDPDVFAVLPVGSDTLTDFQSPAGETVNIYARFYNMGTGSLENLKVFLIDDTNNEVLDTIRVNFAGLDTNSCRQTDMAEAVFTWTPGSNSIGVHRLRIFTDTIPGEPDPWDNTATLVYLVRPGDYASQVLSDLWDMTETTSPPAWKTDDIVSMIGWNTQYTDSISGMFEGTLTNPNATNSMVLNTGSGVSDYIDTSQYENISLAGKAEIVLDIRVYWVNENNDTLNVNTGVDLDTDWAEIGPVNIQDLNQSWNDEKISSLWLEFHSNIHSTPTDVRVGWIKLTE